MPITHLLLAFLVAAIWGINFLFVKFSLEVIPPLSLCALRFIMASLPAIFFIKPPDMPFKTVALYGLVMFALQFSLLFLGMHAGMTPGVASLIMQVQIFFSMLFAALFLDEKPTFFQVLGALVSFSGIALIGTHLDSSISLVGFLCILAGAATWGMGNLITKKNRHINMFALVVWGSFVACFPMIVLAFAIDGPSTVITSYHQATGLSILSLLYIVYVSTLVGYGVWNWLLSHYPIGVVVPFTLLIPIVGMLASIIVLGEPLQLWKMAAGALMILGLCINLFAPRFFPIKTLKTVDIGMN